MRIRRIENYFFFVTKLHPTQGLRATQGKKLNGAYDMNGRDCSRKW